MAKKLPSRQVIIMGDEIKVHVIDAEKRWADLTITTPLPEVRVDIPLPENFEITLIHIEGEFVPMMGTPGHLEL